MNIHGKNIHKNRPMTMTSVYISRQTQQ